MIEFAVHPSIYRFDTCREFVEEFQIKKDDLILTNAYIFEPAFGKMGLDCHVIYQEKYGSGEPSDEMIDAIARDIPDRFDRIIAVGGGTVIDIAKILSLEFHGTVEQIFESDPLPPKAHTLIAVPTTCGTGSEVTNVSIIALKSKHTKKGLAYGALYANSAVLIPELLVSLPFSVFSTSSIDALIHAIESALSPNSTASTKILSYQAMDMILHGYLEIVEKGQEHRKNLLNDFLLASNYAGIAFNIAGTGSVHAMSYPLGSTYHVAHGESNYAMFLGVMRKYVQVKPHGEIEALNAKIAAAIGSSVETVYTELEKLLNFFVPRKALHEYGCTQEELVSFTDSVLANQQRLLRNSYIPATRDTILSIYQDVF